MTRATRTFYQKIKMWASHLESGSHFVRRSKIDAKSAENNKSQRTIKCITMSLTLELPSNPFK